MIKSLPKEVREKLRSGVAIPSLQQCVEELILNSIDAGATCVGVRMDMEAFKVQVIDNGSGITAEDLECIGNRYCTSKCSSVEDLDNLRWYGFRGEALASLVSLATLVEISSRTRLSVKTHVKLFKDGKGLDVFEAETVRPSAGTTVVICNFFYNMPVRRKRVDGVLEGERIRHRVEAISLMHPSVSFTLKNDCTGTMMVQLPKARNTYHRFVQIHSLARAEKLAEVSYTHKQFEVGGYIGKEGHYNNSLQYLYVNDRLLLKTHIHKLLNFLLRRLSSSNQKNEAPDGTSVLRSPKHKRNHEQNGVYIINIKCSYSEYDICLEPAKTLIEFKDWDGVLLCVEEAVKAFLKRENLVSSQDDLDCVSSEVCVPDKTENQSIKAGQAAPGTSSTDCGIEMKLASVSVHRKSADDGVCRESGLMERRADEADQLEQEGTSVHESQRTLQCDLKSASPNAHDEEELTFSQSGEGSGTAQTPDSQECALLQEKETQLIDKTATCETNSRRSFVRAVQSDLDCSKEKMQSPDGHEQSFVSDRKIGLSDPYIHKSLQIRDHFQTNYNERTSKRKNTLEADNNGASQKLYVPFKIPRILSCQKLSTSRELGSLDKFRRTFVKHSELKLLHPRLQNYGERPPINSFANNPETISVCEDNRATGTREEERTPNSSQRPLTLSDVKDQRKGQMSLTAKLCNLKQQKTENVSRHVYNDELEQRHDNQCSQDPEDQVDPGLDSCNNPQMNQKEEDHWLHHYDASIGKIVYVNRMTGLSRYEDPAVQETQVRCTSDVTNMAVSVISEMGVEYRCYPFQVDSVLPFLPKSRPERVISAGTDSRDDAGDHSNSLSSLYSKWKNPVFVLPPAVGVDISSRQAEGLAVKIHNILFPYRFSKAMIHSMKVIHQVDAKFLACLINTRDGDSAAGCETEGNLLVLVDQHAAHERVRLEHLVADSYEEDPDVHGERRLCSSTILPPLKISITEEELRLLRSCQQRHLRSLGLEVSFSETAAPHVFVGMVPLCFMEKESNELRRGRSSVIKPIVEEYLREQIELLRSAGRVKGTLPLTVLKVLASLACHGAIKFNDTLSRDECCSLVTSLSSCQLPFQCAHGRPSIVPLVDILHLDNDQKDVHKPNLKKLRRMYKAWKLYGNN
nr:DNA mismatch repair protein Mlh3 isoform X1 [Nothobranchius furzeri]